MTKQTAAGWALCAALTVGAGPAKAAALSDSSLVRVANGIEFKANQTPDLAAAPVEASPRAGERVIGDRTTEVNVDLNAQSVKCSAQDYSMPMLKVLVPALADLTLLNHRNSREGAPCIAAGRCSETLNPAGLLKTGEGTERIAVRVVLKKATRIDGEACHVSLIETVSTTIRGIAFFHERVQAVADRQAADCR